jgi:hypothetical protein
MSTVIYNATVNATTTAYNSTTFQTIAGFSLTNRWLLYASIMLSPAMFISGVKSNFPTNLGFLAYNWYTQITWYQAAKAGLLGPLSLLPVHFNTIYAVSYLGGVSAGNDFLAILLGIGTAGVMGLNNAAAWQGWIIDQPEGFGQYEFFFYGWRTLSPGWHKFIMVWNIADTLWLVLFATVAIALPFRVGEDNEWMEWFMRYPAIPVGAICILVYCWPLILWVELIYARNHVQSDTDMIAVWLFVAQVVLMLVPLPF